MARIKDLYLKPAPNPNLPIPDLYIRASLTLQFRASVLLQSARISAFGGHFSPLFSRRIKGLCHSRIVLSQYSDQMAE